MYCYFPLPHFLAELPSRSRLSSNCLRMCLLKCGLKSASQHKYRLIYQYYVKEAKTKELMNHATRVHATIEEKMQRCPMPTHLFGLFIKNKTNSFQIIVLSDFPLVVCKCLLKCGQHNIVLKNRQIY